MRLTEAKSHGNLASMGIVKDEFKIDLKGWEIVRNVYFYWIFVP